MNKSTDGYIIRKAEQIDRYLLRIREAVEDIWESQHPHKNQIVEELEDNGIAPAAWASHCIHRYLASPEKYETGNWGIRRKKG